MRKHLLALFIVFSSWMHSNAQYVLIPDSNFRVWLINYEGYGPCFSGHMLDTTCSLVVNATTVDCFSRNISSLEGIQYFDNLERLYCNENQLTSLPTLPASLTYLECEWNLLTALPSLPASLTYLDCSFNQQLTTLPSLPASLIWLDCGFNELTTLPSLPASLTFLACYSNGLTALPNLPDSLTLLDCANNLLTTLPPFPNSLTSLNCHNNLLTSLPTLPDSLYNFYCDYNPNLTCLPQVKKVRDFLFNNTGITCLPNYPQSNTYSYPALNTIPLCDLYNANACSVYWNISGKTYLDSVPNCAYNIGEPTNRNLKLQLYSGGVLQQEVFTNSDGIYTFDVNSYGSYEYSVDSSNIPFTVTCPAAGFRTSTITALDSIYFSMDFGLRCKQGFDVGAQSVVNQNVIFRPANYATLRIAAGDMSNYYGAHCAATVAGTVQAVLSGPVTYISNAGTRAPSSVAGNTITWNIADFGAVDFFNDFRIIVQTDTFAQLGSTVCISITVTPTSGDYNTANNTLTQCWTVRNSYDPNIKEVYPLSTIPDTTEWLTYTVHFQNTGNAEAQHIFVEDTLDNYLDISTFKVVAYSHPNLTQVFAPERRVRFNFPNINLPDSFSNEPLSHGYIQYQIKLLPNLPQGTDIRNTAYIYFDFNPPVVTNTTVNTTEILTSIANTSSDNLRLSLYPNPTTGHVNIQVDEALVGGQLTVTDITGRRVKTAYLSTQNLVLNTDGFSHGVYFVTVTTHTGNSVVRKLVKE